MAEIKGRNGKLAVSTNGTTYTDLGSVTDVSFPFARGTIDITNFDGAGWEESLSGIGSFSISATLFYDEADSGQDILWTANENDTILYYRWRPAGDLVDGIAMQYIFQANLTSLEQSQAFDGAAQLTLEAKATGAPTIQVQPVP
jgi:hypothetical protein